MTGTDHSGDNGHSGNRAKAAQAFRTIREVSDAVGVPPHILRFWETRFPQLKPMQRGGNRRYYRPADVALAHALHQLLHEEGYTVKGVQKLIASDGLAAVVARGMGHGPATPTSPPSAPTLPVAHSAEAADLRPMPPDMASALLVMRERLSAALAA